MVLLAHTQTCRIVVQAFPGILVELLRARMVPFCTEERTLSSHLHYCVSMLSRVRYTALSCLRRGLTPTSPDDWGRYENVSE